MGLLKLFILSAIMVLSGCAATVMQHEVPEELDPRPVYLLDHGLHASLIVAREDGALVRYVYGEWRWYAMRETGFLRVFPTLFTRTQAALGRRELPGPADADLIRRQLRVEVDHVYPLEAPANKIDALLADLDERFDSARDTLIYNPAYDLEFVHDPRPYHLGYNSNHVVAEWLKALDIEVVGTPVIGKWRLAHTAE